MGTSLNVAFSKKVSPYGLLTDDHPALGNGLQKLNKAMADCGLPTLQMFVSNDPAEWHDMDENDPLAESLPPLQWFEPSDGLIVVDAAIELLRPKTKSLKWARDALFELALVRAELAAAQTRKAQFRFEIND